MFPHFSICLPVFRRFFWRSVLWRCW